MPAAQPASAFGSGAQGMPQPPQCDGSSNGFDSHPFVATKSQSFHPLEHPVSTHVPPSHFPEPFGKSQEIPHVPQLYWSVRMSMHVESQHVAPA